MNISEKEVTVFLDQDGQSVLALAMGLASVDIRYPVYVQDTDDIGIWARIGRQDGEHTVLIRWEYVLSVDFPSGIRKVGLKP